MIFDFITKHNISSVFIKYCKYIMFYMYRVNNEVMEGIEKKYLDLC